MNEALGVWKKRLRAQRRMRSRSRLGKAGVSEAEPVGSSIKERIEPAG